jgi:thioredoxin:protein disulfide reductase
MKMRNKMDCKIFLMILSLLMASFGHLAQAGEFLEPDAAFRQKSQMTNEQTVQLDWVIAPGYNLYKEKLHVVIGKTEIVSKLSLPAAIQKFDKNFNKNVEVYHDKLSVSIPKELITENAVLKLQYQGCSDEGLCYSPIDKSFQLSAGKITPIADATTTAAAVSLSTSSSVISNAAAGTLGSSAAEKGKANLPVDEVSLAQSTLQSGSLFGIALSFLGFGLLLAFTPCVLPMVPILSSIIVGSSDDGKPKKGFLLAVAYSLGMVMVYTSLGVAAGLAGEGLAAALQKPSVLIFFASMLFLLSLSMFDVYVLQVPGFIQNRLNNSSMNMQGGRFISVFIMGALSALIVGPCVAGPLAGALIYISQSRDVVLGGLALFCMAVGMSVPLLLTGASAGALLPKVGAWMIGVKYFFGLMLMATAIWMLQSVMPQAAWMALWGAWLITCAIFLKVFDGLSTNASVALRFGKVLSVMLMVFGVMELLGAGLGAKDVLRPLEPLVVAKRVGDASNQADSGAKSHVTFERITSLAELQQKLQNSKQVVMLDFYADWCTSCIEMEKFTFSDPDVKMRLANVKLLQIDVTKNSPADQQLMKQFKVFGPPALLSFDLEGNELTTARVIGYKEPEKFKAHLDGLVLTSGNKT